MGLRQKSRRIRFGALEYIAVAFMVLTAACAATWWLSRPSADWQLAPARVVGATLVENTHPISASPPQIRLYYRFVVLGHGYVGNTPWDTLARVRYRALPPDIQALLSVKGYRSFKDLPPEVQRMLEKRGINRIDAVPEPLLDTLRAQGFNSVHDFPEDVRRMVKEGEYESAAREMDRLLAERMNTPGKNDPGAAPLSQGGVILVRYDPDNPVNHYVVRWPVLDGTTGIILLVGSSLLLFIYCGVIYPRAKR